MIVGTDNEAKSVTKTILNTKRSVGVIISSNPDADSCWMFTNLGEGVTVWDIMQDGTTYSATSVAADEMQIVTGVTTKLYVGTSTNTADTTFDIMYQGGYTIAVAAVSLAALTIGSF